MRVEDVILTQLSDLSLELRTLSAFVLGTPEWFGLRKACDFKGIPYNSVKGNKYKQPRFGIPDKMDGTKKYWSRKSIVEWSQVINAEDQVKYRQIYLNELKQIH